MRRAYVHEAVVVLAAGGDVRALGAAVTVALCGHWDHEPPCPLAPHHTAVEPSTDARVRLRVLFAAEPAAEAEVRERIEAALRGGALEGPDGVTTRWRPAGSRPGAIRPDEAEHAERLVRS
ncbi:hypothetical protein AB0D08_35450 [Kitasatospora sp. NPDC048540]|uniref:hypothetical protein n=1 Tax=unclassified Kitasatospora TaxID=2633591 RepID=UPI00068BADE5|nr:hypothetical protein [Kitasatospora sp. MBT63]